MKLSLIYDVAILKLYSADITLIATRILRGNKVCMRDFKFQTGEFYHIYNRGVEKRDIFGDEKDFFRFLVSMRELNNNLGDSQRDYIKRKLPEKLKLEGRYPIIGSKPDVGYPTSGFRRYANRFKKTASARTAENPLRLRSFSAGAGKSH